MAGTVTLSIPSLPLALAVAIPIAGWALHLLTAVPPAAASKLHISPGLASVPPGPLKTRIEEIYPEHLFGDEGGYAPLPLGRVKYALSGPKDGRKVSWWCITPVVMDRTDARSRHTRLY